MTFDLDSSAGVSAVFNSGGCGPNENLNASMTTNHLDDGFTGAFSAGSAEDACFENGQLDSIEFGKRLRSTPFLWTAQTVDVSISLAIANTTDSDSASDKFQCWSIVKNDDGEYSIYNAGLRETYTNITLAIEGCTPAGALLRTSANLVMELEDGEGKSCDEAFPLVWENGMVPLLKAANGIYDPSDSADPGLCVLARDAHVKTYDGTDEKLYVVQKSTTVDLGQNGSVVFAVAYHYFSGPYYPCLAIGFDANGNMTSFAQVGSAYKFSVSHGIDSCTAEWTSAGADQFAALDAYAAMGESCDPYENTAWEEGVVPELAAAGGVYDVFGDPEYAVAGMCANMTSGEMVPLLANGVSLPYIIEHSAVVDLGTNSTTVIAVSSIDVQQFKLYFCFVFELSTDGSI